MRAFAFAVVAALCGTAMAQPCGHFVENYGLNQLNGRIQASVLFDDGNGTHLYVAGEFRNDERGPGRQGVAMWTGSAYVPVGGGLDGPAWALTVYDDDGPGPNQPALYVGGTFQHAGGIDAVGVAKWDGHNWSALG